MSNVEYITVPLIEIIQKDNRFFVGKMKASDMLCIYTVNPVEYDLTKQESLLSTFKDGDDYFASLINSDKRKLIDYESKGFQREFSTTRVNEISDFVTNEEYALFPNTIITTCELINPYVQNDSGKFEDGYLAVIEWPHNLSYFEENENKYCLYIPKVNSSLIIVDGQHRIEGLKRSPSSIIDNYELLVSFMLEYDKNIIAKLFYTINYTQKSVNKSLLYHLTGEFSDDIDEITFLHELVKVLNESKSSPFFRRIKMLGKADKHLSIEEKKRLTVSQAFMIDYLLYTIKPTGSRSVTLPIFSYYHKNKKGLLIIRFIVRYFMAVKSLFGRAWEEPENSVLSKTTGVGALLKLLNFVFIKIVIDGEYNSKPDKIDSMKSEKLIDILKGIEKVDLSIYAKAGGAGKLNQLLQEFIVNIEWFEAENYSDFLKKFRANYASRFQNWPDVSEDK